MIINLTSRYLAGGSGQAAMLLNDLTNFRCLKIVLKNRDQVTRFGTDVFLLCLSVIVFNRPPPAIGLIT